MKRAVLPYDLLLAIGAAWGTTVPLTKIAISTDHGVFGLMFWQLIISVTVLGLVHVIQRKPVSFKRPVIWFYVAIAFLGTLIPTYASYIAIAVLPAGLIALFVSLVPIFSFPIALTLGVDKFSWKRLAGLSMGLVAVFLIVGVPDAIPVSMLVFVPLALIAPLMYAMEGNFVAKWGTGGAGPIQLLLGASVIGALICLPMSLISGQFISPLRVWAAPEWALLLASVIHAFIYTSFVALIRAYGTIFAQQVSYVVTASGIVWAMIVLGETYSGPIWLALAFMFAGIYLVNPQQADPNGSDTAPD